MRKQIIDLIKYFVIGGNSFYILWFLYNEFTNGFKIPIFILIVLLVINTILLIRKHPLTQEILPLCYLAICGNIFFILFILYNGINEGFKATIMEKFFYFGMMFLLAINSLFLFIKSRKTVQSI
jgi:hypothetical protein